MSTAHRQYSRKFAAILTVLAMVLALFPVAAFAQEQPKFSDIAGLKLAKEIEEAAKAGLVEGYPDGTFKPKQNVTRAEFAKMIVNALEKATGKALPTGEEPFSDVSEDSTLYEYVVKAYNAKLIQGYEDGRFGYSDPIQRQQAAAIIARALGLEETEENFPDVDPKYHRLAGLIGAVAKAGLMQGYDNGNFGPTDKVQRDQAAAIAVRAYNYLKQQQPAALEVAEVRVPNLKQVEIVFNQPVDKASAENLGNYRVYAEGDTANLVDDAGAVAALQEDGKTVLLTLEGTAAFKNGSKENKVEVLTGLKSAQGAALEKAYSTTVAASDSVAPTLVSVKQIGTRWLQVTFSEPVRPVQGKVGVVQIDKGAIGVVEPVTEKFAARSLLVRTYADIKEGEHTVTVRAKMVQDFAGLENQVDQELKFQAVTDSTVPQVTVTKATPTEVKLVFSQPVVIPASDNIRFRAIYNEDKYEIKASDAQLSTQVGVDKLVDELTLSFAGKELGLGAQKLYIEYINNDSSDVIKSAFGVRVPEQALDMTVVADTTKPVVEKVETEAPNKVKLTFNKKVDPTTGGDADNYTVKDSAGNTVGIKSIVVKDNVVTLELADNFKGGTYTLTVSGIKDTAFPPNTMDPYTTTFGTQDEVDPQIVGAYWVESSNSKKVIVLFSEPMATTGAGSAADKSKYTLDGKALGADDKLEVTRGDQVVVITLSNSWTGTPAKVKIDFATDKAGNPLPVSEREETINTQGVPIKDAAFVAKDRLQLTFGAPLAQVDHRDFSIVNKTSSAQVLAMTGVAEQKVVDGESVVVFVLGAKINADGSYGTNSVTDLRVKVAGPGDSTTTAEGIPVAEGVATTPIKDRIAPSLVADKPVRIAHLTSGTIIRIEFDEAIDPTSFGTESFKVDGYRVDSAGFAAGSGNKIIELGVTAQSGATKTPNVQLLTSVRDMAVPLPANQSEKWTVRAVDVSSPSLSINETADSVSVTASNPKDGFTYSGVSFEVILEPVDETAQSSFATISSSGAVTLDVANSNDKLSLSKDPSGKVLTGTWGAGLTVAPEYNATTTVAKSAAAALKGTWKLTVRMKTGSTILAEASKNVTVTAGS